MTSVAVLLPVRDGAATLPECLQSLEEQTFRPFRVFAVNDGSRDETPRILEETARRWEALSAGDRCRGGARVEGVEDPDPSDARGRRGEHPDLRDGLAQGAEDAPDPCRRSAADRDRLDGPRMTVLHLEPGRGIAGALAVAAAAAAEAARETGVHGPRFELFARQDADDRSLPQRFDQQVSYLAAHPEIDVLATGIVTVSESPPTDGWRRYESWLASCREPEEIARNLWIESPLPHPTVMARRSAFDRAGGYRDVPWPEDYDLWLRMLAEGIRMAKLPEPLYEWRDHPGRATRVLESYTPAAFLACRAHHLARKLNSRPVIIWGAGRDGRRAARALLREGVVIDAFLDIDPRKIGRQAYGRPILAAEAWLSAATLERDARVVAGPASAAPVDERGTESCVESPGAAVIPCVLAAVGTAGARELIRARCDAAGLREGSDYLCIA